MFEKRWQSTKRLITVYVCTKGLCTRRITSDFPSFLIRWFALSLCSVSQQYLNFLISDFTALNKAPILNPSSNRLLFPSTDCIQSYLRQKGFKYATVAETFDDTISVDISPWSSIIVQKEKKAAEKKGIICSLDSSITGADIKEEAKLCKLSSGSSVMRTSSISCKTMLFYLEL